ncbi:hypothetical protein MYAM1_003376 [Malassezia yamatoensis]|uniref:Pal1 cell morphology protein n=1 Tax=Malassezia yamatoensis TaxID=253288 RepID=A0AAJ5YUG3_9BASI|nr:hypothetical protein MYAM1_003376 [Malassezia yamatoensis]
MRISSDEAPKPPPKSRKELGRLLGRSGRSGEKNKKKNRISQYVEPRLEGDDADDQAPLSRIDVIDQLDISGVHGASLFHHDSPYDACSPHVNQESNRKAPIRAFDPSVDPVTNQMFQSHQRGGRTADILTTEQYRTHKGATDSSRAPFQNRDAFDSQSSIGFDSPSDAANPNAELFGVATEPWQEFANSTSHGRRNHPEDPPSGRSSRSSSFADMETYLRGNSRSTAGSNPAGAAKPPSSSRANEVTFDEEPISSAAITRKSTLRSASGTSRSKSLLDRFRRLKVEPDEVNTGSSAIPAEQTAASMNAPKPSRSRRYAAQDQATPTRAGGMSGAAPALNHSQEPTTNLSHLDLSSNFARGSPELRSSRTTSSRARRSPHVGDSTDAYNTEFDNTARSNSRYAQSGQRSLPALPPKQEAALPTRGVGHHADYTEVVPDADRDQHSLGRSKTFLSRLANSSKARVI